MGVSALAFVTGAVRGGAGFLWVLVGERVRYSVFGPVGEGANESRWDGVLSYGSIPSIERGRHDQAMRRCSDR